MQSSMLMQAKNAVGFNTAGAASSVPDLISSLVIQMERSPGKLFRSSAAPMSSAAPERKSFDRGGPVWPPRSKAKDGCSGGCLAGLCPPSEKTNSPEGVCQCLGLCQNRTDFQKYLPTYSVIIT